MRTKRKSWLCAAGWLVGMTCSLFAAEFAAPTDGPLAFRRDRIPLEVDAMVSLSERLGSLAGGVDMENALNRRGAAQMLALALALDPGNGKARKMLKEYETGRYESAGNEGRLDGSRAGIRRLITWLETPGAGADGQALAACLKDVVAISESKPAPGGEQGAWTGWVPDLAAYKKKVVMLPEKKPEELESAVTQPEHNPILLANAEVQVPLLKLVEKSEPQEWVMAPGALQMTATQIRAGGKKEKKELPPFTIVIGKSSGSGPLNKLANSLKALLKNEHAELPAGVRIQITSKEFELALKSKQLQSISAAAAVLANSALTGREPESIIIGQIDESGEFSLPSRFWDQLQSLGKGSGQRLVLPATAAPYLFSILAMERPEFFFEYEVLLASDFKQLLEMTAKVPDGALASAIEKFEEIRERKGTQDLRSYIGNSFVKQRVALVLQDLPYHASAKMLLIQASGSRPTLISREVLAAELRQTFESIAWILKARGFEPDSEEMVRLGEAYDSCRPKLDSLERYVEKSDIDLYEDGMELAAALRSLDKASRSRGEPYDVQNAVRSAHIDFRNIYTELIVKFITETGDTPPILEK